ncbi:hypothetical protein CABS02_15078 [Colletotrichum abscissum]|uniref:Uncharacterized protein n=1 Tax=Colletotrichum abscissum TaxID=1671311 RepID=A0A9P9X0G4_9PEZI|nr:hypothetical protein CABS02_15078 [Colletotrichum abscissum]
MFNCTNTHLELRLGDIGQMPHGTRGHHGTSAYGYISTYGPLGGSEKEDGAELVEEKWRKRNICFSPHQSTRGRWEGHAAACLASLCTPHTCGTGTGAERRNSNTRQNLGETVPAEQLTGSRESLSHLIPCCFGRRCEAGPRLVIGLQSWTFFFAVYFVFLYGAALMMGKATTSARDAAVA